MALCPKCNGTGIHPCHRCEGKGQVAIDGAVSSNAEVAPKTADALTGTVDTMRCPSCHGVRTETCRSCDGAGEI
jgi:RecJ-like exonuclease